jgi:hypothetical protein
MPQCAWHPGTETNVSCPECGRYMCPKDMIDTPVGYKCKECGRAKIKRGGVKPSQLAGAVGLGLAAAVVAAALLRFVPIFLIGSLIYGVAVGEATRRGGGGHRSPEFAGIAAGCAALGVLIVAPFLRLDIVMLIAGPIVAYFYVSNASW